MILYEEVPEQISQNYTSWKGIRDGSAKRRKEMWEYYFNDIDSTNTLYTKEQLAKIKNLTNLPVSINHIYPTVNQELAILAQTKTSHQTISFDGRAKEFAYVLDKMAKAVMYASKAMLQKEEAVKEMLTVGMSSEIIEEEDIYMPGEFGVTYRHVPSEFVILDANSRDRSDSDREGFFIEKEITHTKAKQLYGSLVAEVNKYYGEPNNPITVDSFCDSSPISGDPTGRLNLEGMFAKKRLRVREYYDLNYTTMYMVEMEGKISRVFAENFQDQNDAALIISQAIDKWENIFVRKTVILGDKVVCVVMKPITKLPLKTTYFEFGGRPYDSKGLVHYIIDMQNAYDKAVQIMLVNGMIVNSAKIKAPVGSIPTDQRESFAADYLDPTKVFEYIPQVYDGKVLVPEREVVQTIPNFYLAFLDMMSKGIEFVSNVNPIKRGDTTESKVEVFSTMQQYQSAAMERTKLSLGHMQESAEYLGQVLTEYLVANIETDTTYSFFDDKGDLNETMIASEIARDLKLGKYKVMSVPGTLMASERTALSTEMMKVSQSTSDPTERKLFFLKGLEMADIRGTDEILEQLDIAKNMQGQIEQMSQQLERSQQLLNQQENARINAEVENKILKEYIAAVKSVARADESAKGDIKARAIEVQKQIEIDALKEKQKTLKSETD